MPGERMLFHFLTTLTVLASTANYRDKLNPFLELNVPVYLNSFYEPDVLNKDIYKLNQLKRRQCFNLSIEQKNNSICAPSLAIKLLPFIEPWYREKIFETVSRVTEQGILYCSGLAENLIKEQNYTITKNLISRLLEKELIMIKEYDFINSLLKHFFHFESSQINFEKDTDEIFVNFMRNIFSETQYTTPYIVFKNMLEYTSQEIRESVFEDVIFYYPEKNAYKIIEDFIPFLNNSFKDKIFYRCIHKLNDRRANIFIFTAQKILEYISRVEKPDIIYSSHQRAWDLIPLLSSIQDSTVRDKTKNVLKMIYHTCLQYSFFFDLLFHREDLSEIIDVFPVNSYYNPQHSASAPGNSTHHMIKNLEEKYPKKSLLNKEEGRVFLYTALSHVFKDTSYLGIALQDYAEKIFENSLTESQSPEYEIDFITTLSKLKDFVEGKKEKEYKIYDIFFKEYLFDNYAANSINDLSEKEKDALYLLLSEISIEKNTEPLHTILEFSCLPGQINRSKEILGTIDNLLDQNFIYEQDFSSKVLLRFEKYLSIIFKPESFALRTSGLKNIDLLQRAYVNKVWDALSPTIKDIFPDLKKSLNEIFEDKAWAVKIILDGKE